MGPTLHPVPQVSLPMACLAAVLSLPLSPARAQMPMDPHQGHGDVHREHEDPHRDHRRQESAPPGGMPDHDHALHMHDVGPAGDTYELRFIDAMVQHHTGALRMSEFVFDIGEGGVGALGKTIWREQAQEIRAMNLWRKRWYPEAPVYPVVLAQGGDPDSLSGLVRMSGEQILAMRMLHTPPNRENRVVWFLEGMLHHHGAALKMAHDARAKSSNATIRRFAREVIVAQRAEIRQLRGMLRQEGLEKPEYYSYDPYFAL